MSAAALFVTGTDTGVGKTRVAVALLLAARAAGLRAAGYKPVASGCERVDGALRNEDALALLDASVPGLRYEDVNPVALAPPIAPHIAAAEAGAPIRRERIDEGLARLRARCDLVVVEGAGGWRVPLGDGRTFADWVAGHGLPVVLVVGMRLGCLNHALLSAADIAAVTRLCGWVANFLPPKMDRAEQNLATLDTLLPAPRLAQVAPGQAPQDLVDHLTEAVSALRAVAGR